MENTDQDIITIASTLQGNDSKKLLLGLELAKKAHDGQIRKSGEPYMIHPIAVAKKLWERYQDVDLTIAGLLHDATEDSDLVSVQEIHTIFGAEVGFLIEAVDKTKKGFFNKDIVFEDRTERLLWAGLQDIRVLLLKTADREHNIDTLTHLASDKQVRMAFETQAIYKPLKVVLGLYEPHTIQTAQENFQRWLHEKGISKPDEIKKCLYTMSFKDFSDEMFELVYNNSHKVVWEIEDKAYLEELAHNKEFEEHANIENMWTDGDQFKASFTFDKGYLLDGNVGMKVSSYKSS